MAGAIKWQVRSYGFKETLAICETDELLAQPIAGAMEEIGRIGAMSAQAASPIGATAQTFNRIKFKVQKRPLPRYTVVHTTAVKPRTRFPYTRVVNFSPFAQSRYRTGTNPNYRWMNKAMERVQGYMATILDKAADEVEVRFARKGEI